MRGEGACDVFNIREDGRHYGFVVRSKDDLREERERGGEELHREVRYRREGERVR